MYMFGAHSIELVFENIESIVIPIHRVKELEFGELEPIKDDSGNLREKYRSEYLSLEVTYQDETELDYHHDQDNSPLGMFVGNPLSNNVEDRPDILGRILEHQDLVVIEFLDQNQKVIRSVYVPWHEEDEILNRYIQTKAENGLLKVEIRG